MYLICKVILKFKTGGYFNMKTIFPKKKTAIGNKNGCVGMLCSLIVAMPDMYISLFEIFSALKLRNM
jgi:hypothetical protein